MHFGRRWYQSVEVPGQRSNELGRPRTKVATQSKGCIHTYNLIRKGAYMQRQTNGSRALSSPRTAFSSCFRSTLSFEMYLLCVLVFQPGTGPACEPRPGLFSCFGLCEVLRCLVKYTIKMRISQTYGIRLPKLRTCGQWEHDFSKKGFVTPKSRPAFGGSLLTS